MYPDLILLYELVLKMVMTATIVVTASVAAERSGPFIGALIVARLGSWPHKGRLTLVMGILYGFVLSAFALSPWPAVSAIVLIFSGFIGSVFYSTNQILVQLATSEAMRGRVMGALAVSFGLMPVGALFIGALAQQIGTPLAVTAGSMVSNTIGFTAIEMMAPARI